MSCADQGPKTATDCTPCSPGVRNRYFRGKLLTVADYQAEQRYMIQRRQLINRSMLGWGVVSGYRIALADGGPAGFNRELTIGEGIAFDRHGREVVACSATALRGPHDVVWLCKGGCGLEPCEPPTETPASDSAGGAAGEAGPGSPPHPEPDRPVEALQQIYLLAAHYAERRIDGVMLKEGCGDEICETNRVCETVVYSLVPLTDCPPGIAPCPDPRCDPEPEDWQTWEERTAQGSLHLAELGDRGPHRTLVGWSLERSAGNAPCREPSLCRISEDLAFDPDAGVPLACVTLGFRCGEPHIALVADSIGPRRLTRPNDVLFDLIRGCDLTRIKDVGWRELLDSANRTVTFEDFAGMFVGGASDARPVLPVDTRFWVLFSGPVQLASLSPDVIAITLLHWDSDEAVRLVRRMPITGLKVAPPMGDDPPDSTRAIIPVIHGNYWLEDIHSSASAFDESEGTIVEIGVRGGLIVDVHGQLLAAGGGYLQTRPGWPGSDFISVFTVLAPSADERRSVRRTAR